MPPGTGSGHKREHMKANMDITTIQVIGRGKLSVGFTTGHQEAMGVDELADYTAFRHTVREITGRPFHYGPAELPDGAREWRGHVCMFLTPFLQALPPGTIQRFLQ